MHTVSGCVLMPDGSPASGAMVEARDPWKEWGVSATAEADASGRFEMSLPPGRYWLQAASGVFVYMNSSDVVEVKSDGTVAGPLELRLRKGCLVQGSVVDKAAGKLLSGARLLTRSGDHAETGPAGSFSLLLPKGSHTLTVVKEGFYRPIVHINCANQDTMALLIETKPEGIIKGRVTDQNGEPVAGARVGASGIYFDFQSVKTDENGQYTLLGHDPDSRVEVSAFADGYEWAGRSDVVFPPGEREITVDFQLVAAKYRDVAGRVLRKDGTPTQGAEVSYGWTDCYGGYKKATTDQDGKFLLERVDAGKNLVVAEAKGFAPAFKFVEADVSPQIELVMEPGHWLEGKFVNEEGEPLEGVSVSVDVETDEMAKMGFCGGADTVYRWVSPRTASDKEGRFRLEDLPAGRILIETHLPGYVRIDQKPLEVDRNDHVILVERPGHIFGTVLSAKDDKPIPEFQVFSEFQSQGTSFNSPDGRFTLSRSSWTRGEKRSLVVEVPGYLRAGMDEVEVKGPSDADFDAVKFRLRPAITFGGVVGEAETGSPLEAVLVTVLDTSGRGLGWFSWDHGTESYRPVSVRTDAKGGFSVANMPLQRGSIMLEKSGYGRVLLRDVGLSKPLEARLAKGSTISGVIKDDSGRPVARADVSIEHRDDNMSFGWMKTDAEGKFRVTDLPAGLYAVVHHHADNNKTRVHMAEIAAGREYAVAWDRPGEVRVEGTVTLGGAPSANVSVTVNSAETRNYAFGVSGEDGSYELSVRKPGEYTISWRAGEWMDPNKIYVRREASLKRGTNRFDMALPDAVVSGRVIDKATRRPIAGAKVRAYVRQTEAKELVKTDWSWQHTEPHWWPKNEAETDANGRFEMKNLAEGEWLVAVKPEGRGGASSHTRPFKLQEGETKKGVTLEVVETGSAAISVWDAGTGKAVPTPGVVCRDENGFSYYPDRDESCGPIGCSALPKAAEESEIRFSSLPPGRYRALAMTPSHLPGSMTFEVKSGRTSEVALKLRTGGRIVFRLLETEDDRMPGIPWVGYKVTRPGVNRPVLEDAQGPCWGNVQFLRGDPPREAALPIEPGKYQVEAVLRTENQAGVLMSGTDLWAGTSTVKVQADKDAVIEIPWK